MSDKLKAIFEDNGRGIYLKKHGKNIFGMHKTLFIEIKMPMAWVYTLPKTK